MDIPLHHFIELIRNSVEKIMLASMNCMPDRAQSVSCYAFFKGWLLQAHLLKVVIRNKIILQLRLLKLEN
jgi:hypothetical protein